MKRGLAFILSQRVLRVVSYPLLVERSLEVRVFSAFLVYIQ